MTAPYPYVEVVDAVTGRRCTLAVDRIAGVMETTKGSLILVVNGETVQAKESYDEIRKLIGILAD